MPYITEEIWRYLPGDRKPLILAEWPHGIAAFENPKAEAAMETIKDLLIKVRQVRTDYDVEPSKRITALISGGELATVAMQHQFIFARLCNLWEITSAGANAPENCAAVVSGEVTLYLPLAGMVDYAAERERLLKERESLAAQIDKTSKMLANEGFVSRAKPDVVQKERDKLAELQAAQTAVDERLKVIPAQD
jgi:valyl-tRNA synthetase